MNSIPSCPKIDASIREINSSSTQSSSCSLSPHLGVLELTLLRVQVAKVLLKLIKHERCCEFFPEIDWISENLSLRTCTPSIIVRMYR